MMSCVVPLKQHNNQSRITLETLKHCCSNLAPAMYITKETQWHSLWCYHDNSYATGSVLCLKFPDSQKRFIHSHQSNERVKTTWEPYLFWARPFGLLEKVANGDIWFFTERDWSQECCHGNNIAGFILFLLWCALLVPSYSRLNVWLFWRNHLWRHHFPHSKWSEHGPEVSVVRMFLCFSSLYVSVLRFLPVSPM